MLKVSGSPNRANTKPIIKLNADAKAADLTHVINANEQQIRMLEKVGS